MAIFHLTAKIVSRGRGQSAIAKAAYNSRQKLANEDTGKIHDYTYKEEPVFTGIFAPKDTPDHLRERESLWSEVEKREKRKDAQLARDIEIALPHELTDEQRRQLVTDYVRENFVRKGMIADVAIHSPGPEGDSRNHHAHILLTMREVGPDGFGKKIREWNSQGQLQTWRENWANLANRYLERHGHDARIDHRSLEEQGSDREATIHLGPAATQLERQGEATELGDRNREVEERNSRRADLKKEGNQVEREEFDQAFEYAYGLSRNFQGFTDALKQNGFTLSRDGDQLIAFDSRGRSFPVSPKDLEGLYPSDFLNELEGFKARLLEQQEQATTQKDLTPEEEKERADAAKKAATMYSEGGMVQQQRDAMIHFKDKQKALNEHAKALAEEKRRKEEEENAPPNVRDHAMRRMAGAKKRPKPHAQGMPQAPEPQETAKEREKREHWEAKFGEAARSMEERRQSDPRQIEREAEQRRQQEYQEMQRQAAARREQEQREQARKIEEQRQQEIREQERRAEEKRQQEREQARKREEQPQKERQEQERRQKEAERQRGGAIGKEEQQKDSFAGRKDQAQVAREDQRARTEQTGYQKAKSEREALREKLGLRRQEGRGRDDDGRERERER